ncbi:hypothetical protein GW750_07320 [bacterium]|nr:hypothetical protein [bacterium]
MVHALQSRIAERKQTLLLKYERVMEQLKKLPAPIRRIIAIFLFLI